MKVCRHGDLGDSGVHKAINFIESSDNKIICVVTFPISDIVYPW